MFPSARKRRKAAAARAASGGRPVSLPLWATPESSAMLKCIFGSKHGTGPSVHVVKKYFVRLECFGGKVYVDNGVSAVRDTNRVVEQCLDSAGV